MINEVEVLGMVDWTGITVEEGGTDG